MRLLFAAFLVFTSFAAKASDLINGSPADPNEFGTVVMHSSVGNCTGTIVGERVVIFAAHCAAEGANVKFQVQGSQYNCRAAKSYSVARGHDMALCYVDRVVVGITYENVNVDPNVVNAGQPVLLTGFGCIWPGGTGGNDGVFRVGGSYVSSMPNESQNAFDYITTQGAAICFGDSGGPAFRYFDASYRVVISTNSKADMRSVSYITSTSTEASRDFLFRWSALNQARICGVDRDAQNCRR